jgi:hypothetical protein
MNRDFQKARGHGILRASHVLHKTLFIHAAHSFYHRYETKRSTGIVLLCKFLLYIKKKTEQTVMELSICLPAASLTVAFPRQSEIISL